jgi:hypothetical protein
MGVSGGTNRIDVAMAGDRLRGFEIKSAADNLARLPAQAAAYDRVFVELSLVGDAAHLEQGSAMLRPHWGLIEAVTTDDEGGVRLETRRRATLNPARDPLMVARLLWRPEALALAERHDLAAGLGRARRPLIWASLVEHLSLEELEAAVIAAMRARPTWRAPVEIADLRR